MGLDNHGALAGAAERLNYPDIERLLTELRRMDNAFCILLHASGGEIRIPDWAIVTAPNTNKCSILTVRDDIRQETVLRLQVVE